MPSREAFVISSTGLLSLANKYQEAAQYIIDKEGLDAETSQPCRFLLLHSLELSLKAFLSCIGFEKDQLCRHGHDLKAIMNICCKNGFSLLFNPSELLSGVINSFSDFYKNKELEYFSHPRFLSLFSAIEFNELVKDLVISMRPFSIFRKDQANLLIDGIHLRRCSGQFPLGFVNKHHSCFVPNCPGVYMVIRNSDTKREFLNRGTAGRFKERDPNVSIVTLNDAWVPGAQILYIGMTNSREGLRKRIRTLLSFGSGNCAPHWGGRFLWQISESLSTFKLCWMLTKPEESPMDIEQNTIALFSKQYGKLPFANIS